MTTSLQHEPDPLVPDDLLETSSNDPRPWRIAHVKSRREKALAHFLRNQGMGYFLPMVIRRQPNAKRLRYSMVPIFPGYLFFKATDLERHKTMQSNHIARVIEVTDQNCLARELRTVHSALEADVGLYPYGSLKEGQKVRIIIGPMKGTIGVVEKKKSSTRLIVNVTSIFQSVAMDIQADMVEPVDFSSPSGS